MTSALRHRLSLRRLSGFEVVVLAICFSAAIALYLRGEGTRDFIRRVDICAQEKHKGECRDRVRRLLGVVTGKAGGVGRPGLVGPSGTNGAKGTAGARGSDGRSVQGAVGSAGSRGPAGPQGPRGARGPQGVPGVPGPRGLPGPAAPVEQIVQMVLSRVCSMTPIC